MLFSVCMHNIGWNELFWTLCLFCSDKNLIFTSLLKRSTYTTSMYNNVSMSGVSTYSISGWFHSEHWNESRELTERERERLSKWIMADTRKWLKMTKWKSDTSFHTHTHGSARKYHYSSSIQIEQVLKCLNKKKTRNGITTTNLKSSDLWSKERAREKEHRLRWC